MIRQMLPDDVIRAVEAELGTVIIGHTNVGGGCIANTTRLQVETGHLFLKWSRDEVARTFPPEAAGLRALREADPPLRIPEPTAVKEREGGAPGFLVMEWIESGRKPQAFWADFGRGLAELHRHTSDRYGFGRDNFIGRLPQTNDWSDDWVHFFRTHRLARQVKMARERKRWRSSWDGQMDRLTHRLADILPSHPDASILHGDLWGGNFLVAQSGRAALIDPATYFGHRETDLAMTRLFGGFDPEFYAAYEEAWPLEAGHEERFEIYNLYHIINHLNHFGSGYAAAVERILSRY